MILAAWGSAWGTWRAGVGVCAMGVDHPKGVIKNIVPIVMAGVLGIYGLIVSVIIVQAISPPGSDKSNTYSIYNGYTHVRTWMVPKDESGTYTFSILPVILLCHGYVSHCQFFCFWFWFGFLGGVWSPRTDIYIYIYTIPFPSLRFVLFFLSFPS